MIGLIKTTIDRRMRSRMLTVVAQGEFRTEINGAEHVLTVRFVRDGNGRRFIEVSPQFPRRVLRKHRGLRGVEVTWGRWGDFPSCVRRTRYAKDQIIGELRP